jgi:uncharacterized 2Fe-2S/4Fe-4S cluster protein (DUF4445 family)
MNENYCMITVRSGNKTSEILTKTGVNLHKALLANGFGIYSPCGGKGTCGKCKVHVSGKVSEPAEVEKAKLSDSELRAGIRLSCQVSVENDIKIELPDQKSAYIQVEGLPYHVCISPFTERIRISLPGTGLEYCPDDAGRLLERLNRGSLKISPSALNRMSDIFDGGEQEILVTVCDDTVTDVSLFDIEAADYGFAVDIGTTTIVGYLINMESGAIADTISEINEQAAYGSDVLSRISYGKENKDGNKLLHSTLVNQLGSMLEKVIVRNGISKDSVSGMSFAGNTTMMHFLLGLNPFRISVAPFTPVTTSSLFCLSGELGISILPDCPVYLLPSVSGYVGADITAGMLACSLLDENKIQLLVDIGTNGEMALSKNGVILCCSVAAGPAFEGAGIRCGVGGIEGAVDSVFLENGDLRIHTINDKAPVGLCGSGLVDAVSLMVQNGMIDEGGRFAGPGEWSLQAACLSDRFTMLNGERVFIISGESEQSESVFLCQQDIREVQLAKAAVHAGITTLLQNQDIDAAQVDTVWLAGGFGNKLKKESAINIGLLPAGLSSKIRFAGNTSGIGAIMALLSKECRDECELVKNKTKYLELSALPGFNDTFIDAIGFDAGT